MYFKYFKVKITALAILKRRKNNLFEEIKSFEMLEKRRYQANLDLEKNLMHVFNYFYLYY